MSDTNQRLHAIVHGRVQGVSFRYYTNLKARELGIVGWVLNRNDGTVEVMAEGSQADLQALKTWLHTGSPSARVERVESNFSEATGEFNEFKTVYRSS